MNYNSANIWGLKNKHSAKVLFSSKFKVIIMFFIITLILTSAYFPQNTFLSIYILSNILLSILFIAKLFMFFKGISLPSHHIKIPNNRTTWDKYSIIIPLYKEGNIIMHLIKALNKLNYPQEKVEVLFALEENDKYTLKHLRLHCNKLKTNYLFCIIPKESTPRTKPNACNYALQFASGKYITIYDAEDRPEPNQLKKAVLAFESMPKKVQCLQCRLNFYNRNENWICNFFSFEYTLLFNFTLPLLSANDCPIPLGGTSNHFRTNFLKEIGAWDSYNVTEDADLGLRIFSLGYGVKSLNSYTFEEATKSINSWVNQRSRWFKGYMQTLCVLMKSHRIEGIKNILSVSYLLIAPCILSIILPTIFIIVTFVMGAKNLFLICHNWNYIFYLNVFFYFLGQILMHSIYTRKLSLKSNSLIIVYFIMSIYAGIKAFIELIFMPHYWRKTTHGVSKIFKE